MFGVIQGIGNLVSGGCKMVKDVFTGHPIKALEEGLNTGLKVVSNVVSDPLVDSAVGFALGGPVGAMAACAVGQGVGALVSGGQEKLAESCDLDGWDQLHGMLNQSKQNMDQALGSLNHNAPPPFTPNLPQPYSAQAYGGY